MPTPFLRQNKDGEFLCYYCDKPCTQIRRGTNSFMPMCSPCRAWNKWAGYHKHDRVLTMQTAAIMFGDKTWTQLTEEEKDKLLNAITRQD